MNISSRGHLGELLTHFNLPRIVVEVGVAAGVFSKEMLSWGLQELHLVDIWENVPFITGCASFDQSWHDENYAAVQKLILGTETKVHIWKGFSYLQARRFKDESVSMIYVDGDHNYSGVKADIESWWSKLIPNGIMAFHDYGLENVYGVNKAVKEFSAIHGLEVHELIEDGKLENKGAWIQKI